MDSVENNINLLISELKKSQIPKEDSLDYLAHIFRTIVRNNVPSDQRYGAAMTVNDYLKNSRGGNFRYADGFLGNWAKSHADAQKQRVPLDPYDVDDVGC